MTATRVFEMHSAREALAGGLGHIEEQVKAIESSVFGNPGLAFDLARALVESACRTLLVERQIEFTKKDKLPTLFRTLTERLPLLPPTEPYEGGVRKSLHQTINGLGTALQGVCELRNSCGFASHGSDAGRPSLEPVQALLAAQAADVIVGFLWRSHLQDLEIAPDENLEYSDNDAANRHIDEANDPVRIFDLEYRPSDVLFHVDLEAYRNVLANYDPERAEDQEGGT